MLRGTNGLPDKARLRTFITSVPAVDVQVGPGGDLFYVSIDGEVRRVRSATNNVPTARASATPDRGPLPLRVAFDGRTSSDPDDPDGSALDYAWDFDGDGTWDDFEPAPVADVRDVGDPYGAAARARSRRAAGRDVGDRLRGRRADGDDRLAGPRHRLGGRRRAGVLRRRRVGERCHAAGRSADVAARPPPLSARRLPRASDPDVERGRRRHASPRPTTSTRPISNWG